MKREARNFCSAHPRASPLRGLRANLLLADLCSHGKSFASLRFCTPGQPGRNYDQGQIAPPGAGSGGQWVRHRFPDEWQAIRQARNRKQVILVVGTDADTLTVDARRRSLLEECAARGVSPPLQDDPAVLMVVPKRNIETWFAYLRGQDADEDNLYPRYPTESECKSDVAVLDEMCRSGRLRRPLPPSLGMACGEYRKIG